MGRVRVYPNAEETMVNFAPDNNGTAKWAKSEPRNLRLRRLNNEDIIINDWNDKPVWPTTKYDEILDENGNPAGGDFDAVVAYLNQFLGFKLGGGMGGGDNIYTISNTITANRTLTIDAAKSLSFDITGTGSFKLQDSGTDFASFNDGKEFVFDGDGYPDLFKINGTDNIIGIGIDPPTSSFLSIGGTHKLTGAGAIGVNFNATYETPDGVAGNFWGICQTDTYEIVGNSNIFGLLNFCISAPTVNIEAGSTVAFISNLYIETPPPVGVAQYTMIIEEGDCAIQSEIFIGTGSTNFANAKIHLGDQGTAIFNKQQQTGAFEIYSDTTTDLLYADYTADGSIGIGTSTPGRKLHVDGEILLDYTPSGNPGLEIVASGPSARALQIKNSNDNITHNFTTSVAENGVLSVQKDDGTITFQADAENNTVEIDEFGVIEIGADVNLYRSSIDELKTDDNMMVIGFLQAGYFRGQNIKTEVIAVSQNNYDIEENSWIRLDPGGAGLNVTGFTNGVAGRILFVSHVGALGTISLLNENAGSDPNNRIISPLGASIQGGETKILIYDPVSQRWRCVDF